MYYWTTLNPFTFVLAIIFLCGLFKLLGHRVRARDHRRFNEDDTRAQQEFYRDLRRMEDRIEALETLLLDQAGQSRRRDHEHAGRNPY